VDRLCGAELRGAVSISPHRRAVIERDPLSFWKALVALLAAAQIATLWFWLAG